MYYTVIKHSSHLRTLEKCRKHSPAARAFHISLVFSNACRVLSQCNTRLRLLYLLNKSITCQLQLYLNLGTEILLGKPCHVKASFKTLLSCKATWRAGRVGSPGVAVCGARLCRWADPTLSFTRSTNRSDMARPRPVDVWRSCFIILCCSGRRLGFEVVFSLLASVSFVTVIAGLLSGACPETEYEFDCGTGLACWSTCI